MDLRVCGFGLKLTFWFDKIISWAQTARNYTGCGELCWIYSKHLYLSRYWSQRLQQLNNLSIRCSDAEGRQRRISSIFSEVKSKWTSSHHRHPVTPKTVSASAGSAHTLRVVFEDIEKITFCCSNDFLRKCYAKLLSISDWNGGLHEHGAAYIPHTLTYTCSSHSRRKVYYISER